MSAIRRLLIMDMALTLTAWGGGIGKIGGPIILPLVKHKVLVLEFDSPEKTAWGKEISQVLSQEILGTMSGVTGAGVITLRQSDPPLDLTESTVVDIARKNGGLVIIWGEFYQEGPTIFVHSHLRVVPQNGFPESGLGLAYRMEGGEMSASPPTLQVNFSPIALSRESLESLRTSFDQTVRLHETSSIDSRAVGTLNAGDTYYPIEKKNDWMKIRKTGDTTGWIRYATLTSQTELADLRGIGIFAQGILQFISGNFGAAVTSLDGYLAGYGSSQDPMNQALAHILSGTARWRARGGSEFAQAILPRGETVSREYRAAADLLPNSSSPVGYLAIARLAAAEEMVPEDRLRAMQDLEQRLIHVVQTENDSQAVQNLIAFYKHASHFELLKQPGMTGSQYSLAINRNIQLVQEIAERLKR